MLGVGCRMQLQELKYNNDVYSHIITFLVEGEMPKKKPSVANNRTWLGLAAECNNREIKFNNYAYSFIF